MIDHGRWMNRNQLAGIALLILAGCAPLGCRERVCNNRDEKPKGDWTANEAIDYARNCAFD